jgi:hypothetical protein
MAQRRWGGLAGRFIAKAMGLVVPDERTITQACAVFVRVVSAEEQDAGRQGYSDVGLSTTAITVVTKP